MKHSHAECHGEHMIFVFVCMNLRLIFFPFLMECHETVLRVEYESWCCAERSTVCAAWGYQMEKVLHQSAC